MANQATYDAAYNSSKVTVTIGTDAISGYVKGSSVKASYDEPRTKEEPGMDGVVVISINPSQLGTVELNLQPMSRANRILTTYAQRMRAGRADAFFPISIKDLTQNRLASGTKAWVSEVPPLEAAEEAGGNMWKIRVADLDIQHNGTGE